MNCLIIAAHGSRKKESNREVAELTQRLAGRLNEKFDRVEHAFLQFSPPLLEEKLDELAKSGAQKIVVFPFFIGSGSHIMTDIPGLVHEKQAAFPDVKFKITRHLGRLEAIEQVIIDEVTFF